MIGDVGLAEIEQVGDLVVALEALARGRGDDEAPGGIGLDDGLDFLELFGVRNAGAAEFGDFDHCL